MKLFAYGTLMDQSAMEDLIERKLTQRSRNAQLRNYQKFNTPFGYPVILPQDGVIVNGILWSDLDEDDFVKLDAYEDCDGDPPLYFRKEVIIETEKSQLITHVYVGNPEYWKKRLNL